MILYKLDGSIAFCVQLHCHATASASGRPIRCNTCGVHWTEMCKPALRLKVGHCVKSDATRPIQNLFGFDFNHSWASFDLLVFTSVQW